MLFYMATRYEGTDTTYNLEMQDSTSTSGPFYGKLSTLLEWHYADPPDSWERRRNDRIQERQGNRNPYIDHPEFVTKLWVPHAIDAEVIYPFGFVAMWYSSLNAQSYRIDVSTDPQFTNLLYENLDTGTNTSQQFAITDYNVLYYRVRAFLGSGYSPYSNVVLVNWGPPPPLSVISFTATTTELHTVYVHWITLFETGIVGFNIFRNTTSDINGADLITDMIPATNTSYQMNYGYNDWDIPTQESDLYYWLQATDMGGESYYYGPLYVHIESSANDDNTQSPALQVLQLYPNPFNTNVQIEYNLKESSPVQIQIFNLKGQQIRSWQGINHAGTNRIVWDGRDNNGKAASSGVYLLRISTPTMKETGKLLKLQ
jgi:hypothetical protein